MTARTVLIPVLFAASVWAADIPAGTELQVRLKTKVSSNAGKTGDPVQAVLIRPLIDGGQVVLPMGTLFEGAVKEVKAAPKPEDRALLDLAFAAIKDPDGKTGKIAAKVIQVDNARETVDDAGKILGILGSETITARMDQGIGKLAQRASGLAGFLEAAKAAVLKQADSEISYEPGIEMTLALTQPLKWEPPKAAGPQLEPVPKEEELAGLAQGQPFLTVAEKPPKPSDMTNLMFIGTQEELVAAFEAAGWIPAAALTKVTGIETFRAIAEQRGYKEAPMSTLLLDGQKPDLNYQKQNNTFAMRHHLRVWKRPASFDGRPVWVCAATHDTGIEFSQQNRTFIHKIDSEIDKERAKVVSDFLFTGKVKSLALVDRPKVPRKAENATGDQVVTDGAIAVLLLK